MLPRVLHLLQHCAIWPCSVGMGALGETDSDPNPNPNPNQDGILGLSWWGREDQL